MATDSNIEQRIAAEKAKIKVDSYQDIVSEGSWKAAARSLWSISALGAATGMFIGAAAVLFTAAITTVTMANAIAVLPAAVAGFGALGMSAGFAGGAMWGRSFGAAAAAAKEQERRIKEFFVENTLTNNPRAEISENFSKQSPTVRDGNKLESYFNPKVGIFFAAVGVAGGLIMAAAAGTGGSALMAAPLVGKILAALTTGMAPAAASAVTTAFAVGTMAAFGAIFGVNYPKIALKLTDRVGSYLSGERLGSPWKSGNSPAPEPTIISTPQIEYAQEAPQRAFAGREKAPAQNYEQLVNQSIAEAQLQR